MRPWKKQRYCIPEKDRARFVAQMEEVLDVYTDSHSEEEPLICMDEAVFELKGNQVEPITLTPGNDTCIRLSLSAKRLAFYLFVR